MEKIILTRQSRSQMHFTTEGTEKVRTEYYAVGAKNFFLLLTSYCLLFSVISAPYR